MFDKAKELSDPTIYTPTREQWIATQKLLQSLVALGPCKAALYDAICAVLAKGWGEVRVFIRNGKVSAIQRGVTIRIEDS